MRFQQAAKLGRTLVGRCQGLAHGTKVDFRRLQLVSQRLPGRLQCFARRLRATFKLAQSRIRQLGLLPFPIDLQQPSPLAGRGPLLQPTPLVSMAFGFFMASALLGIALLRQRQRLRKLPNIHSRIHPLK